jgi:hypothetical protein
MLKVAAVAEVVVIACGLVACGNQTDGARPSDNASTTGDPATHLG